MPAFPTCNLDKIWVYVSGKNVIFVACSLQNGGLAQLARALAWHARGRRFDSDILHENEPLINSTFIGVFVFKNLQILQGGMDKG